MAFTPKAGCPMCSIVASASQSILTTSRLPITPPGSGPEILWKDDNFTAYRERANPVSSAGHIIIAFNLHVPSIYSLSSSDLPMLAKIRILATRLLSALQSSGAQSTHHRNSVAVPLNEQNCQFRIGFITPPFRDNKIPVTDHLHAHAYILPADQLGWWRGIGYSPVAWYAIDDLIAEIRESVSNNRVKSGYENRLRAPIDSVPSAGARSGTANGLETSAPGLANEEIGEPPSAPTR